MALHSYVASCLAEYGAILTLGDVADILRVDLDVAKDIAMQIGAWVDPDEGMLIARVEIEAYIRSKIS